MIFRVTFVCIAILLCTAMLAAQSAPDLLSDALDSIGFTRADLGYSPKGYWTRFPTDIPYKLKSFDDLFAEPLKLYDYSKSFAGAVRRYCSPTYLDSLDNNLYRLTYFLGVERKVGGMRVYGANTIDAPEGEIPFIQAVENLYISAGKRTEFVTFGKTADWPDLKNDIAEQTAALPYEIRRPLGMLIENIREAMEWREIALRNVPYAVRQKLFYIRDIADTQGDGQVYYPEIDDAAQSIDFESLFYAGLKVAEAAEKFEHDIQTYRVEVPPDYEFDFPTPFGQIILRGTNDNTTDASDCLLLVDFGGDDTYTGPVGATSRPDRGISIAIDLDGNDNYDNDKLEAPSCGAGILGIGLLYDAGGSDRYHGRVMTQGCGFFGLGILFDKDGIDDYKAETSAQGCGYFGIGLAIDCSGDDKYYIYGDGQGMGGIGGGVGCLADYSGDDVYTAEPSAEVVNRGDYHSDFAINVNNAQGAGFGRRGDGADGHSWAGGLGAIVDISGNDTYISGNWSLGCGYWFGTGICYDGEGDDIYQSVYFTQASGAHFCNGVLVDEAGNDKHLLYETAGAALGFGWDFTNALFIDRAGNDEYEAKIISYGLAQIRSFAFFFDMGGADSYTYNKDQQGFGAASYRDGFDKPSELHTYSYEAKSAGIFIDAEGMDNYFIVENEQAAAAEKYVNDAVWRTLEKNDEHYGFNNFGIGIDADSGHIPELEVFDE